MSCRHTLSDGTADALFRPGRTWALASWLWVCLVLAGVWALGGAGPLGAADPPGVLNVSQLNDVVKNWVAEKNPPQRQLKVEGRISAFNKQVLSLRHCEVMFVGEPVARVQKAGPVELTGHLQRAPDSRKIEFVVEGLRFIPSDIEQLEARARQLSGQPPAQWNELADWAEARGTLYKDQQLLGKARDLRYQALELEAEQLPADDSAKIFELADRATQAGFAQGFVQGLNHRGCLVEYRRLGKKAPPEQLDAFLALLRERLPQCDQPGPAWDPTLRDKYFNQPEAVYAAANAAKRVTLNRLLYAEVQLRSLLARLKADNSNVLEVARLIERLVPEEAPRAAELREERLSERARQVTRLTRTELQALETEYRNRNQPAHATKLVEDWLAHQRQKLDPGDVEGAIDLANDYKTLTGKSESGVALLLETWNRVPGSAPLQARLEEAGLHLVDGQWLTPQQMLSRPEPRFARAIRAGRVEVGMTAEETRKALGAPTSIARVVTSGLVTEFWRYAPGDGSQRAIRLERLPTHKDFVVRGVIPASPEAPVSP
jgi:hypothetical protein